eukprot:203171-Chlamydomonas_euryale.AAC.1
MPDIYDVQTSSATRVGKGPERVLKLLGGCVCKVTTLDSSAPVSRMDQTGSTRSYPTSTTA